MAFLRSHLHLSICLEPFDVLLLGSTIPFSLWRHGCLQWSLASFLLPSSTWSLIIAVSGISSKPLSVPQFFPVLVHSIHKPSTTFNHMHMSSARSLLQATSYTPRSPLTSLFTQKKSIQNLNGKHPESKWKNKLMSSPFPIPKCGPFQCSLTQQMTNTQAKILDTSLSLALMSLWPSRVGCKYQLCMLQTIHTSLCLPPPTLPSFPT